MGQCRHNAADMQQKHIVTRTATEMRSVHAYTRIIRADIPDNELQKGTSCGTPKKKRNKYNRLHRKWILKCVFRRGGRSRPDIEICFRAGGRARGFDESGRARAFGQRRFFFARQIPQIRKGSVLRCNAFFIFHRQ